MSELTPEELALLESEGSAAEAPAAAVDEPTGRRPRPPRRAAVEEPPAPAAAVSSRGPVTPAQYVEDDGWGGLPVQMRG